MSLSYCTSCGTATSGDEVCGICGTVKSGISPGFLPLLGWLAIPFSVLVYPLMGSLSTLAMVVSGATVSALGASDGIRLLVIAVTGYMALIFTLRFERAASRRAGYRAARTALRAVICVAVAGSTLFGSGKDLSPGAAVFIALVAVPLVFWLARRLDRVLGVAAPARPDAG